MSQRQVSILLFSEVLSLVIWYKITNISQKSVNYFPKLEAKYSSETLQIHKRINIVALQKTALSRFSSDSCRIFSYFFSLLVLLLLCLPLLLDLQEKLYSRSPKNNRHTVRGKNVTSLISACLPHRKREKLNF